MAGRDGAAGAEVLLFSVTALAVCTLSTCTLPSFTQPDTHLLAHCAHQARAARDAAMTSIYSLQESSVSEVGLSLKPI